MSVKPDSNSSLQPHDDNDPLVNKDIKQSGVKRDLATRHIAMIALGGAIGTGLFMASGKAISTSGAGGTLVGFIVVGVLIYFLMTGLGELSTSFPVSGSFSYFSSEFVDPALGFASGWNEFLKHSITYAVDIITIAMLIEFWITKVKSHVWSAVSFSIIFIVNAVSVSSVGEIGFWLSMIKIIAISLFMILGTLRVFGVLGGKAIYFKNFHNPFPNVSGIMSSIAIAGFSFQGSEMVGMTAGEAADPSKSIPKAVKLVFWLILSFYVFSLFLISCIIPKDDPSLLGSSSHNVTLSPFTKIFQEIKIPGSSHIMNAVILSSVLSAGISATYTATRMLYSLAENHKAPKIFAKTTSRGVPFFALMATSFICLCIYSLYYVNDTFYSNLIEANALAGFLNWFTIGISHYRFRKAFRAQGFHEESMHYAAPFFPFAPIFVMVVCCIAVLFNSLPKIQEHDWFGAFIPSVGVFLFIVLYFSYKIVLKTKVVPLIEAPIKNGCFHVASSTSQLVEYLIVKDKDD